MSQLDLTTLPKEVQEHIKSLESQLDTAKTVVEELEKEVASKPSVLGLPTVDLGKQKVTFLLPKFKLKVGSDVNEYISDELAKNKEFIQKNLELLEKRGVIEVKK